ncbi:MAG: Asp23/Gls24 family envelope stress response protein [Proteobacteria bacterium]|nr:Asp23/Gls24 family envelope stress response protein [Pseudomonadota bacterium]
MAAKDTRVAIPQDNDLSRGTLEMSESVVAAIANFAGAQVKGVHSIGRTGLNLAIDGKTIFDFGPTKGVHAEVGKIQAALDMDVVLAFGCDIDAVTTGLRAAVAEAVKKMTGRKVIEINIDVVGIELPDTTQE